MPTIISKSRPWLLAIILIAFALRFYNLTYHSLWFDEAISVHWARQTVPRILEVGFNLVEDRLPPLYYLTLKGWTTLFGFSETSVRSLSVFIGVLLIPVMANIAIILFNRRVAYFTALLVALNPFLIWYAQETRMYIPAALFSALTVRAFLRIIEPAKQQINKPPNQPTTKRQTSRLTHHTPEGTGASRIIPQRAQAHHASYPRGHRRITHHALLPICLFILFATAGLYSHLYTGFLLPASGLWLIISYPRAWRVWLLFAISGLIITLAFVPQSIAIWHFSGEATPGDPFSDIGQRAWWLLQAFTIWKASLPPILQTGIPVTIIFFTIFAFLPFPDKSKIVNPKSRQRHTSEIQNPTLLTTLLLIVPFIIANLLLFRNHLAFFGERYFIVMTPWLLLLAAAGVENLSNRIIHFTFHVSRFTSPASRFLRHLPHFLLLTATVLPLPGQWSIPATKEAWRQSVAYLATHAEPDHGILIHPDWVRYPFQFYFQGPGQTYAAFSTITPETSLDGPLQGVVSDHPVIWLIQAHLDSPDPDHRVEQWFATRYPLVTELYPPGITLKGYAPGYQLDTLPPEATPTDIQFENGLHLVGYQVDTPASATDELFHPPSGWTHVILYWTASQPITSEATPFLHLVGPEGVWGASLERPNDALKLYPPSRWLSDSKEKSLIRHDVDVNLNPVTPTGIYQLIVGLPGYETQYPLTQIEIR